MCRIPRRSYTLITRCFSCSSSINTAFPKQHIPRADTHSGDNSFQWHVRWYDRSSESCAVPVPIHPARQHSFHIQSFFNNRIQIFFNISMLKQCKQGGIIDQSGFQCFHQAVDIVPSGKRMQCFGSIKTIFG